MPPHKTLSFSNWEKAVFYLYILRRQLHYEHNRLSIHTVSLQCILYGQRLTESEAEAAYCVLLALLLYFGQKKTDAHLHV